MKKLTIPYMNNLCSDSDISDISKSVDGLEKNWIDFVPWREYPYKPQASFAISHANDCIFLKFYVIEKFIKAANSTTNSPVYEDACVEFFISFDKKEYYNFEFNCIGTCLAAFGTGKLDRIALPNDSIDKIKYQSIISNKKNDRNIRWELTLAIPTAVFNHHQISSLVNINAMGNFYKCGDGLPEPHFLAWSNIESKSPDFHKPEFFGALSFQ